MTSSPPRGKARKPLRWLAPGNIFVYVVLIALGLVLSSGIGRPLPASVADGGHDTHIRQQNEKTHQAQVPGLDPHADDGQHPELTDPNNHVGEHLAPGVGSNARSLSQDEIRRVFGDALPVKKGGKWSYSTQLGAGFYAIHAVTMPQGILVMAGSGNSVTLFEAGNFRAKFCDINLRGCKEIAVPYDVFCAGHAALPDGKILIGGGTTSYRPWKGERTLAIFNPFEKNPAKMIQKIGLSVFGHWYPTLVTVSGGGVLMVGGYDHTGKIRSAAEFIDPKTLRARLIARYAFGVKDTAPYYMRLMLTDNPNAVFFTGASQGGYTGKVSPQIWNFRTNKVMKRVPGLRDPKNRSSAASCYFGDAEDGKIVTMGGGGRENNLTDWVDTDSKNPRYRPGGNLRAKKEFLSCITLPNGDVFEANGGANNTIQGASYEVSVFRKYRGKPTALNPMPPGNHRQYHSNLLLLDNGQIASFGSNPSKQARNMTVLKYTMPEISGVRPTLTSIPRIAKRNATIKVKTGKGATRVVFRFRDSSTHGLNAGGQIETLKIGKGGKVKLSLSKATLPPGEYLVVSLDDKGKNKGSWSLGKSVRLVG